MEAGPGRVEKGEVLCPPGYSARKEAKTRDAVKGKNRTPGLQKISGWISSAGPCGMSLASHICCKRAGLPLMLTGENDTPVHVRTMPMRRQGEGLVGSSKTHCSWCNVIQPS